MKTITIDGVQITVNEDGSVIYADGRLIKPTLFKKSSKKKGGGFYQFKLNRKRYLVHRIVAWAYVPNPNGFQLVTHLDTKTTNNHYKNLAWGCQKHIAQNMKVAGRTYRPYRLPFKDVMRLNAITPPRLTETQKRQIANFWNSTNLTFQEIAKKVGATEAQVRNAIPRKKV
jgi:hypothetical protein